MDGVRRAKEHILIAILTIRSLLHSSCRSNTYILDAAFEPVYWFVDCIASVMGLAFVIMVTILTSSVVIIWYTYLFPVIQTFSTLWMTIHVVVAHWLLINIVFHYFKAVLTSPGIPPQGKPMESIGGAVVCKKCIQPKPPRAHHCSVCGKCFLKMDHHCPWMNNCIGFYNHRYFIMFCVFMWLGTVYVCLTTYDLFTYHFFHPGTLFDQEKQEVNNVFLRFGLGSILKGLLDGVKTQESKIFDKYTQKYRDHPGGLEHPHGYEHLAIIYLFLLCSAVTCALGMLNIWHIMLVSRGETSVEVHINRKERQKAAKRGMGYNNPYDYGWRQNWRALLGLYHNRTFLSVLFPSGHSPQGDGMHWPRSTKPLHFHDESRQNKSSWSINLSAIKKLLRRG
eukprot:Seg20.2 transcript_id=Seg20.2/GoldUCD/mRNA.D3Y31 product="Palmitoyltransferase ZDHHC16A" protein_id=Seg20.2/GoldUCD/D3Y31